MADKIRKYKKAFITLANSIGREPSEIELANFLDISLYKLRRIKQSIILEPVSLETSVTDDLCLGDYIEDRSCNSPESSTNRVFLSDIIPDMLNELPERERTVLINRFGLGTNCPKTLAQLGNLMGYSKERIRQIEENAILKLRNNSRYKHFKDCIDS
jgi:RNA polymerase primary sigma factor